MSGVIATSSAVRTQKATHAIKNNNNKKTKLFLVRDIFKERKSEGDFNNLVNDLWFSDRVLGYDH